MSGKSLRDRLFQWLTERYPTRAIQSDKRLRQLYRVLLYLVLPPGRIYVQTPLYRIGFSRRVRDIAHYIALKRAWEPFETQVLRERARPGETVLDIGANVGHYTLVAAQAVGPKGHVYAFEPVPSQLEALRDNIAVNALRNVTVVDAACSDADGTLELFIDESNAGGHSIAKSNVVTGPAPIRVRALKLDSWLAQTQGAKPPGRIGLLKMDTQGAEVTVIRGALGLLRAHRPTLIVEFWPHGLRNSGAGAEELLRLLGGLGYRFATIDERTKTLAATTPERLLASYPADRWDSFTNLLGTVGD